MLGRAPQSSIEGLFGVLPAKKRWAYAYLPLVHPTRQGMGETVPAQNIARITRIMTDVNKASLDSLVICVPSFVRLDSGCHRVPT